MEAFLLIGFLICLFAAIYFHAELKSNKEKLSHITTQAEKDADSKSKIIEAKDKQITYLQSKDRELERQQIIEFDVAVQQQLNEYKEKRLREIEDDANRLIEKKRNEIKYEEEVMHRRLGNMEEFAEELYQEQLIKIGNITDQLTDHQSRIEAINANILREKEKEEKEDFYRIVLSKSDEEDIAQLSNIRQSLHNKMALNKLLYEVFIRLPLNEMIKRVTGNRAVCGIYKITYINTGEAYVGKSVDIGKRWTEHVKSAYEIGSIATSSLHTYMSRKGVQNFHFEIIEETSKEKLTEREKYYIIFFDTINQLNMKKG